MVAALSSRAADQVRLVAAAAFLCAPIVVFLWLAGHPEHNHNIRVPEPHTLIVTLVSLLATIVAVLVARAAIRLEQYQVFLISLGFLTMAGLFVVHGIATPGVLLRGPGIVPPDPTSPDAGYNGSIVGLSAFLSLSVPSVFFATAYTRIPAALARQKRLGAGRILLGLVAALALYAALSARVPDVVASVAISRPPFSLVLVGVSAMLLWFAAWAQLRAYARTGLPTHGALVLAYFLLAEAQILMVVTLLWLLNWWEYHVLMLLAVAIAMGALFIELDRRRGLERFVSAEVVERLVAGGSRLSGEKRVLSILFADLRGSTALGATLPVDAVVEVINAHMSTLARCVLSQGGMVDKYIGDGLLAYFGTRGDASDGTFAAAQAALDMRAAMHALSRDRAAVGAPSLEFGVGIHTGEVILGAIGLSERGDFTVLGDTVNTASRIEGLCKDFSVDIVLSEDCAQRLPEGTFRLRPLGEATVRGKTETIEVFTLE